jgi:hypothetical protein
MGFLAGIVSIPITEAKRGIRYRKMKSEAPRIWQIERIISEKADQAPPSEP